MIASLRGTILALEPDAVLVDVAGVGFRVQVAAPVLDALGGVGEDVNLHTHMHVREGDISLFGALDGSDLRLFLQLLSVSGVGPKMALAIMSVRDAAALRTAIVGEEWAVLTAAPGVGKRTAQRILLELRPRLEAEGYAADVPDGDGSAGGRSKPAPDEEALAALVGLGYTPAEAKSALGGTADGAAETLEERLRQALRALGRQ